MDCIESRSLLHGYVDGELGLDSALMIERHLESCPGCARDLGELRALRSALADTSLHFAAPPELARKVASLVDSRESAGARLRWPVWFAASGWIAAAAIGALMLYARPNAARMNSIADQIVASHVRSLMPGHLTDVASTDQHTVKPWFDGRLDFSPEVDDFGVKGFSLIGGRLDYVAGRAVAALVYRRRKHLINVFEWPAAAPDSAPAVSTRNGYHVIHWDRGGLDFWMVSNLNASEMSQLAAMMRAAH